MIFEGYIVGIFPRNDTLADTWKKWERSEVGDEDLLSEISRAVDEVIHIQLSNELTYIHDPLIDWHDIFRPFTELEGIRVGPITRFFENNTFFKKPIIKGEVSYEKGHILRYIHADRLPRGRPWIISLPGPYTFYKLSHATSANAAIKIISDIIMGAAEDLLDEGYEFVNLLEPGLAYYNDIDWDIVSKLYSGLRENGIIYRIHLFFGDVKDKIISLSRINTDGFSIDTTYTNILDITGLNINVGILGLIDAQNTLLEDPDDIVDKVEEFVNRNNPDTVVITPNSDLDYLPYNYAVKKVNILGEVLRRLSR